MTLSAYRVTLDLSVCVLAVCLTVLIARRNRQRTAALPPGPKGYPLIGNAFGIPVEKPWETFLDWGRTSNSSIVSTTVLGTTIVILNDVETAIDLFEKRSSIYSGRPNMPMILDLMGISWNIGLIDYGSFWRICRRLMHQEFHPEATRRYQPEETQATHRLLQRLLDSPKDHLQHIRQMAGEIIMSITYGIDVLPKDDPYIITAERTVAGISLAANPGRFLVDSFPLLKHVPPWVPGAGFQKIARTVKRHAAQAADAPMERIQNEMDSDNGFVKKSSFASRCLNRFISTTGDEIEEEGKAATRAASATLYAAGSDTTVSAISSAILGLLSNPTAMKNAQAEIDRVIGNDRLPEFADRDALPWVTAIVRETLRWNPVTPLGVAHKLSVDDEYRGYHLPAQSTVIGNTWAMLHDEEVYPDSFAFKPERFMTKDGVLDPTVKDPASTAFGFGRRICPGRYMAQSSVWIAMANILAVFDISKAVDEHGKVMEPTYQYSTGLLSYPDPFQCLFTPRRENSKRLIEDSIAMDANAEGT